MQQDPKDILIEILNIIGYEDEKESYADEFIQNCEKQALLDALKALPKERQETLRQKLAMATDQEQQKLLLKEYITSLEYTEILKKVAQNAFIELIDELMPTLSQEQITILQKYMQFLTVNANPYIHNTKT
ncbi:MAG: hypothetical protein ACYDER_16445 [Ktedonobacteraceae bacterium]